MTAQLKISAAEPAQGPFVINLCSSTTPMALAHPEVAELKRFNFFMSRRLEEGRERFRLHMGYFMTLAEAEEWLNVVRDIFPGAWAGEAPGKRLAERAAAAKVPQVSAVKAVTPAPKMPSAVPTVHAAPKARSAAPATPLALVSNLKEVLKELDETDDVVSAPVIRSAAPVLSDTQVLKILENRQAGEKPRGKEDAGYGIEVLRPDDTTTIRALKEAVRDNAPVSFAVQLQWSVQPIDLAKTPPLAIFSAYTLYTVEGSRDGRKWYGLRLGFFSDAVSAKQVASYVRSEFASVAVLPVSAQEQSRATDGESKDAHSGGRSRRKPAKPADEFKLLDDDTPRLPSIPAAPSPPSPAKRGRAGVGAKGKVRATEKRSPKTLEETLEILGASELEIDEGRGELLNSAGDVKHLRVEIQKNSPFSNLLVRLAERVKKS